ncbi:MAG: hypothetical protein A2284_17910 [Deltaproteobacteria bacterium RIFOXYA12_FULL_61_11]|nr:MAG: hypothetical protein A2284_17910 [Deltaproteobacteria bacterium RIFOXYA12_FULL_61_11]
MFITWYVPLMVARLAALGVLLLGIACDRGDYRRVGPGGALPPDQAFLAEGQASFEAFLDREDRVVALQSMGNTGTDSREDEVVQRLRQLDGLGVTELRESRRLERGGRTAVTYDQYFGDVPVHGSEVTVQYREGRWTGLRGRTKRITRLVNSPLIDASAAVALAARMFGDHGAEVVEVRPVLLPLAEGAARQALALRVLFRPEFEVVRLFLDAEDGTLLDVRESTLRLVGSGSIYKYSPLDGPPQEVPFLRLLSGEVLQGETVGVTNLDLEGEYRDAVGDGKGRFVYEAGDERLEMTMIYYWIDYAYHFYRDTLGLPGPEQCFAAHAFVDRVGGMRLRNNAAFMGELDLDGRGKVLPTLVFSKREGLKNPTALGTDVILHEFNHWVTDSITHMLEATQTTALHEGYSDFFAVYETRDPHFARYYDASTNGLRDLTKTTKVAFPIPEAQDEAHVLGEIYAQTLWDLHQRFLEGYGGEGGAGREQALEVVYRSRFFLNASTRDFREGYEAVLAADQDLDQGRHRALVRKTFEVHGFVRLDGSALEPEAVTPSIAGERLTGQTLELTLDQAAASLSYVWTITSRPERSALVLEDAFQPVQRLVPDVPGVYTLEVLVLGQDDRAFAGSVEVQVAGEDLAPEDDDADGGDQDGASGGQVITSGSCGGMQAGTTPAPGPGFWFFLALGFLYRCRRS